MEALAVILVIAVVIGGFMIMIYNSLIVLRNKVDEGWADIDTQLKRRYDLIPNLVETVKGYAKHEKSTFEEVTKARSMAMQATTPEEKAKAENFLSNTLKSLFAVSENYPELRANQNFMDLQNTLTEIEEHIQMSRRYYNGTVKDFNTKLQIFPNNLVAGILGFKERQYFEAAEDERENVKVSFSDDKEDKGGEAAPAGKPEAPKPSEPADEKAERDKPKPIPAEPVEEDKKEEDDDDDKKEDKKDEDDDDKKSE